MASAVAKLPKPQLRRLLVSSLKRELIIGGIVGVVAVVGYKYGISEPRKQKYAEFFKNYDSNRDFERMRAAGVFTAARPDGSVGEW